MTRHLNSQNAVALQTWHQGALFTRKADGEEGKHLTCPHCKQPATAVHLIWLCKETNKAYPALQQEDVFELEHGLNLEFWSQGLLQLPPVSISTGGPSVQAWGTWTVQDEAIVQHPDVVTIGIARTSSNAWLQHFAVAIVHHTVVGGRSGCNPPRQTILGKGMACATGLWSMYKAPEHGKHGTTPNTKMFSMTCNKSLSLSISSSASKPCASRPSNSRSCPRVNGPCAIVLQMRGRQLGKCTFFAAQSTRGRIEKSR